MFVLIVTANVPTLQPLFRTVFNIRSTSDYRSYSLRPTPKANASAGSHDTSGRGGYPDGTMNTSVDHILPADSRAGIVKTNDFSVTYHTSR